jgi:choline dehydrogenase-like flavoprotein
VVASRLARTSSRPSVLLLEAGGSNETLEHLPAAERFNIAFSPGSSLNWHYKTIKQQQLRGQEIDYSRGKGLGGSTAINFCAWIVGSRDDYDEWAREVQDSSFGWENVKRCLKRIENLHPEIPDPKLRKYVRANVDGRQKTLVYNERTPLTRMTGHGDSGPVHLTYGDSWLHDVGDIFVAAEESGLKTNPDINSGDAIGMGMGSICLYKGQRLTSSSTYLAGSPDNLTVMPNASVSRIIMKGSTAIGVEIIKGEKFLAAKEVIVSGGAINTPQILMLSGLGPEEELKKFEIPVVQHLPMVGRNLQDHCFSPIGIVMKEDETKSTNGATQSPSPMGWFKLPSVLASPEYEMLKSRKRDFLQRPTVPSYEIATVNLLIHETRGMFSDARFHSIPLLLSCLTTSRLEPAFLVQLPS